MSKALAADSNSPIDSFPAQIFTASRWTQGNFLFPTKLIVSPQRVIRTKARLFGSNEESIPISKVASVHISTGVFWSEIVIESTGGTDPITSHGHRKKDAQRIRDLIESYQAQAAKA
ncbi:MAG TPA: PH domain-containing protein [Verrucomicrobiae bacterium]|nr:PH domain-containing protein [Verrucomicrobiae bacterium]